MKRKQIIFTKPKTAEFLDTEIFLQNDDDVMVKMDYTVVSGGTEKANLLGQQSVKGVNLFPISLGYCGVGTVVEIGKNVTKCKIGDRVLVYHGVHSNFLTPPSPIVAITTNAASNESIELSSTFVTFSCGTTLCELCMP